MIVAGVIDVKSHRVEHPRLVAQRLVQLAQTIGQEQLIAGTDCGFGTFIGYAIDPDVAWAKLKSLFEGARSRPASSRPRLRGRRLLGGLKPGQHGQNATVILAGRGQVELPEDVGDVLLNGAL